MAQLITDPFGMISCDPGATSEEACARQFISQYGRRAYRRALADAEVDSLYNLFSQIQADSTIADAGGQ